MHQDEYRFTFQVTFTDLLTMNIFGDLEVRRKAVIVHFSGFTP